MASSLSAPDVQVILQTAKRDAARGRTPPAPFPSPIDWRDQWIYFLMLDRFNNPAAPPNHLPFDDPHFFGFQGGTYAGVRQQLSYIRALGAGAIWLSPVLRNFPFDSQTYHGYGIHDFLRAEPRFATDPTTADQELRDLVDAAHQAGLYVIFDIVLNHTGDAFAYQCRTGDSFCVDSHGAKASFSDQIQPVRWRDPAGLPTFPSVENIPTPPADALVWPSELQHDRFFRRQGTGADVIGDFQTLKQLRTDDRGLQDVLIRAYQYVIARYDCDGFRIDTLRYLQGDLPRIFGNAIREFALSIGKQNFFTFGEVFDPNAEADIARFIGRNTSDGGDLVGVDAALDYPLEFALPSVLKGFVPPLAVADLYERRKAIERPIVSSHGDATRFFVTFLDNHDLKQRFYFVDPANPHQFDDQLTLAVASLFALQGIPCLYYGTEQGLHGRGSDDPAVREALWGKPGIPFDQATPLYQGIQAIARTRAQQPALRYGRQYMRPVSGDGQTFGVSPFAPGVLAFSRILNDEEVVVACNTSTTLAVELFVIVDGALNHSGDVLEVLYSNKSVPIPPGPVATLGVGGALTVHEVDGSTSHGPLEAVRVTLQPLEVQLLGKGV
jgi:glycosidase